MTARRGLVRRLLLAAASAIGVLALATFALECFDAIPPKDAPLMIWQEQHDKTLLSPDGAFRFHPRWLWEPRPGAIVFDDPVNASGYRGPDYPIARSGGLRIATLGDSSTFGYAVKEADSWSRRLEERLRQQGVQVEVLNFGCVGYSVVQGLELFRGRVSRYRPDVVIAAFGCINEQYPMGLPDVPKIEKTSGIAFRVRQASQRFGLVRWLLSKVAAAEKKSWNDGGPDANRKPRVSTTEFHDALAALDRAVRESGGKLVLVCPPRMPAQEKEIPVVLDYTEAVHATAKELAAPLAEVRDAMRAKDEPLAKRNAAGDVSQLFHDVVHPSADGHRAYAEVVAATLADAGLLAAGASR